MILLDASPMIQANQEVIQDLLVAQNFTQAIATCQELGLDAADPSIQWLHGLAVLLNGEEEDAQAIWMMAMLDGDEPTVAAWTNDLVQVLQKNADLQEAQHYFDQAWLIRHHIRGINPAHIDNLLRLLKLEILQQRLSLESFAELPIIELLNSAERSENFSINANLLLETLTQYLDVAFADEITARFAQAIRPYVAPEDFVRVVVPAASIKIGHLRHFANLAIALLDLCLELEPESTYILIQLAEMSLLGSFYETTATLAQRILEADPDPENQAIGSYYQFKAHLNLGSNQTAIHKTAEAYRQNLENLVKAKAPISYASARSLFVATHLFNYWDDNPAVYRVLQNKILALCEQACRDYWQENSPTYRNYHSIKSEQPLQVKPKIRIGYICSCFYKHSVGWLARSLMQHHDMHKFEIYIYAINTPDKPHPVRDFYANITPNYRCHTGDSGSVFNLVSQDAIDILVDLDSITRDTTCTVMSLKPAPIQVTWLGWDAIGISSVDYYIADPYVLPETAQDYYTEKIWRLPQSYISVDGFEIGVPTLRRSDLGIADDAIVFLNPQRGFKLHPETTKLQLEIVKQTPNSYFLVKGDVGQNGVQNLFEALAKEVGLDTDRLRFLPYAPSEEVHRANLMIADVVLDTFPFNGATTTMETLWMERPLVTLVGQQFAARNSYTMMMNAGITEGISWTPEEYVAWGIRLGTEPELRQQVAWKLRQSKQSAPLWNGKAFAQQMEAAYTQMYQIHLEQQAQRFSSIIAQPQITGDDDIAAPTTVPVETGKIIIDGVFFQLYRTGIARLWQSVLQEWATDEFWQRIIVLDRNGTCPKIPGIQYLTIPEFSYQALDADRALLQTICDQENASLFISTYYTTPISTPSVFMGYDMIPEVLGWDLAQPMWQSKHHAIVHATAHITISENTAKDLQRYFPQIDSTQVNPILCGVADHFRPARAIAITQFRSHYNIQKPYFLLVGAGFGYKNVGLFIEGLAKLSTRNGFEVICTGASAREISAEARKLMPDVIFHPLYLDDNELCVAYSGAVALVYPSQYEGFGLPIVEAMKCGCPVITCRNASLPEVGGEAVIYIDDANADEMCDALLQVQTPRIRQHLITAGLQQASKFTWSAMATQMQQVLANYADLNPRNWPADHSLPQVLVCIDWQQPEAQVYESLLRLFQIIVDADQAAHYEFLMSAAGNTIEAADEIVSNAFMQTLMMAESDIVEPAIQLTEQSRADVGQTIVAWFNLADIQTSADFLAAMAPKAASQTALVTHNIHGYDLEFPPSHALPGILQRWPYYSSNLGRIAQAVHQKYPDLRLIDIGANVGDSVAILRRLAHFPILCIEGDRAFLDVLSRNAQKFDAVTIAACYVGEDDVTITAKSTGLAGTAHLVSADDLTDQADAALENIEVYKLSRVLNQHQQFLQPKMIKTDTDGFDGKILRGATDVLRSAKPVVFFEYDPFFLAQQDDNGVAIFDLLADHGYAGLIIYDNFGDLLLCMPKIEIDRIEELNLYFSGRRSQQYCDICAFHQEDQDLYAQVRQSELAFFHQLKSSADVEQN
jgi:FkbM family methyltransferase